MGLGRFAARSLGATVVGLLAMGGGGVAFAAGPGYAPPAPVTPTGTAGGFTSVVTAATIQPSGGTVTAVVDGETITVTVAPGTFTNPVQIVITSGDLTQIGSAGVSGFHAIAAFGISVDQNGSKLHGSFAKPISFTVTGSNISSGDQLLTQSASGAFVTVAGATVSAGKVSASFSSDPNFALLAPNASTTAIANGTSPNTGKPFLLEGLVALALVVGGASALWMLRMRRA